MHSSRFNILVVALVTLVSLCTARTIVTIEKCATRYCGYYVKNVFRTTKTVHASGRYTITRRKTVTKPQTIKTITKTTTIGTTKTFTIDRVTTEKTVWIGTTTVARTVITTKVPSFIATIPLGTFTISPSTRTVPAPSGFVGVNDDPANKGVHTPPWTPVWTPGRRSAAPEPNANANKHATAVTCTKTLLTKTGTTDLWKTITKLTGTASKTVWKTTRTAKASTTVTAKNAITVVSTTSKKKVAFTTRTTTVTTPATWFLTTITSTLPVPTYYAACAGPINQSPPPGNGRYAAHNIRLLETEPVHIIWSNGTVYDCCAACHGLPASQGKCIGSIYSYQGPWGACLPQPECESWDPWVPEFSSKCELILEANNGVCRQHGYDLGAIQQTPWVVVMNGPTCKSFKFGRFD